MLEQQQMKALMLDDPCFVADWSASIEHQQYDESELLNNLCITEIGKLLLLQVFAYLNKRINRFDRRTILYTLAAGKAISMSSTRLASSSSSIND